MASSFVKLSKSYIVHDVVFDTVELREPTYKDIYMSGLGLPFDWQLGQGGNMVRIVYPSIVDTYIRRLAKAPSAENLAELSAIDTARLVAALFDFFIEARKTPPTGSSSGSDGTPAASPT